MVPKNGGWAVAVLGGGVHLSETSMDWQPCRFVDHGSDYGKVSKVSFMRRNRYCLLILFGDHRPSEPSGYILEIQVDETVGC